MRGGQVRPHQPRQRFAYPLQLHSVNFLSPLYILIILFRCLLTSRCSGQLRGETVDLILSLLGYECASEADEFIKFVIFA